MFSFPIPVAYFQPTLASALLAVVVHQVFRTHESYSPIIHSVLLFVPPCLVFSTAISISVGPLSVPWALFLCYGTYLSMLVASVTFYRLSLVHPLASYPGPFWCRVSKLWLASVAVTGKQSRWFAELHDKYGDIVRVGPNELSIRDASLIAPCMGPSGIPKGPHFIGARLTGADIPLVGIQDIGEHMRRRRPWLRGLGTSALKAYQPLITKRTRQLVNRLEGQQGELRLERWFDWFSYDLMTDMAFGGGSNQLQDGDTDSFRKMLEDGVVIGSFFAHVPHIGVWMGLLASAVASLDALTRYGASRTTRRLAQDSKTQDLFHFLAREIRSSNSRYPMTSLRIQNNEDEPTDAPPPVNELVQDGLLVIVAGSDTVASALTSLFFCLLVNPRTYAALQKEVDQFYPREEDAHVATHHRDMPYLQAVIQETLRLFPPLPTGSGRQVPHDSSGFNAGAMMLPAGTQVYFSPWVLHRDPRNFSFPTEFWPERWLVASRHLSLDSTTPGLPGRLQVQPCSGSDSKFEFKHNDTAFLAFSHGPMNCVGKGFAMQEMKTVICALMQRFRFQLTVGWDPREFETNYLEYFVSSRPGLPVALTPRW